MPKFGCLVSDLLSDMDSDLRFPQLSLGISKIPDSTLVLPPTFVLQMPSGGAVPRRIACKSVITLDLVNVIRHSLMAHRLAITCTNAITLNTNATAVRKSLILPSDTLRQGHATSGAVSCGSHQSTFSTQLALSVSSRSPMVILLYVANHTSGDSLCQAIRVKFRKFLIDKRHNI